MNTPLTSDTDAPVDIPDGRVGDREGRAYAPLLALTNFGSYMAILTPIMLTLPLKIQDVVGPDEAAGAFGLVAAIGAVFAIICNPLAGRLSDRTVSRFGRRRPWILGGAIGGVLSLYLIASANSLWMIILGWCLVEIFINSAQAAANATVADQVPDARRGLVSGLVGFGLPIALLVGSIVVNVFTGYIERFVVPGILMLLFSAFFVAVLRDKQIERSSVPRFSLKEFGMSFVFNPRKAPDFGWVWLSRFAIMFGYSGINTYTVYLLIDRFQIGGAELTGLIVANNLASCIMTIISSVVFGVLSDRLRNRRAFVALGSVLIAAGLLLIAFGPAPIWITIASAILGLGGGGFFAVDLALATETLPHKKDTAKDLGVLAITNGLPQSIAPAIAPAIIGLGVTLSINGYQLLYGIGAVVAVLGAVFVYRVKGVR
ncbi:MFS transporter [Herbiconiux ginsengi]|uniref:Na+/melibiose symporter n=1 Tax=Herbiconiux ginsengi TaxID=381665 RepID=A0A1H3K7X7_9MICO|nr:MFS transporter [Herbiconiux ginsengi]SDY48327.1 Na+/melibiose symporter [Herbiconiux ginsengi]